MAKEFKKAIFITHPAFPVSMFSGGNIIEKAGQTDTKNSKRLRWTPKQTVDFFKANIRPRIAESDSDTLVVLIKSPPQIEQKASIFTKLSRKIKGGWLKNFLRDKGRYNEKAELAERRYFAGGSARNERRLKWAEKAIEADLKTMKGVRSRLVVIEAEPKENTPPAVMKRTAKKMAEKGFELSKKAIADCYGAFEEQCVRWYPQKIIGSQKRLRFPKGGAINYGFREGNFGEKQPRGMKAKNSRRRRV